MLWRVRTTLSDRPGSLARLALACGDRSVNILALQIFPEVGAVTDELVLRAPAAWTADEVRALVTRAGGRKVVVGRCSEHVLVDGPTRYLAAVRRVVADPESSTEVLAGLLEGRADGGAGSDGPHEMTLQVRSRPVVVRRTTPFTATEHARAVAFAELVTELVNGPVADRQGLGPAPPRDGVVPQLRRATPSDAAALGRMHERCSRGAVLRAYGAPLVRLDARLARRILVGGTGSVVAAVGDEIVGVGAVGAAFAAGDGVGGGDLSLLVEDDWQRRGVGTRLLQEAARLAAGHGVRRLVLRAPAGSPAVTAATSLAAGSGLRVRVRLVNGEVEVGLATDCCAASVPVVGDVTLDGEVTRVASVGWRSVDDP